MLILDEQQQQQLGAIAELSYCNPFSPDRIGLERKALGTDFVETDAAWHKHPEETQDRANIELLSERSLGIAENIRQRILSGENGSDTEYRLYEHAVIYHLYHKYQHYVSEYVKWRHEGGEGMGLSCFPEYLEDMKHFFALPGLTFESFEELGHLFAAFFQLRRAFYHIFENIIGGSMASARLRATVWQSIFTCDVPRYRRIMFSRMADIPTLITGPSGTGKELVAQAIGLSSYIPFDVKRQKFSGDFLSSITPVNLSAVTPTLIESELFGHAKGAFTGALADREGLFESCPAHGTVFLDELGELEGAIQVKLLRVLHTRQFQRVGENTQRRFAGKIVAATNRNMEEEVRTHRFREDLYYRLCADVIETPSLREQLDDAPEQLHNLLLFITRRVVGREESEELTHEVSGWIREHLGDDYPWPGNVRELEQCVRSYLVRKDYQPKQTKRRGPERDLTEGVAARKFNLDELTRRYVTHVYAKTGNYVATAEALDVDRRTIKAHVDKALLEGYQAG